MIYVLFVDTLKIMRMLGSKLARQKGDTFLIRCLFEFCPASIFSCAYMIFESRHDERLPHIGAVVHDHHEVEYLSRCFPTDSQTETCYIKRRTTGRKLFKTTNDLSCDVLRDERVLRSTDGVSAA